MFLPFTKFNFYTVEFGQFVNENLGAQVYTGSVDQLRKKGYLGRLLKGMLVQ